MKFVIALLVLSSLCAFSSSAVMPQNVRELTDQDFQTTVQNNIVLVTFFSPTCPHCVSFIPELEKVSTSLRSTGSSVLVAKVNCGGGGSSTCSQAGVNTVPTIRLYRNGQAGNDFTGERKAEAVVGFVNAENNYYGFNRDNYNNANNYGYNANNGYNNGYNSNNTPGNCAWKPY